MLRQRALQLGATGVELAELRFGIFLEGDRQMRADKAAERLMQTLRFLHVERERGVAFRQAIALDVQLLQLIFTRGAAEQRHLGKAGIAPLTLRHLHHHRVLQLFHGEDAVVERLRIALNQVEIFRALFQTVELLAHQRQIRHHDSVARRAVERREVRRILQRDVVVNFRKQHAAEAFRQLRQTRIFRAARLAEAFNFTFHAALARGNLVALHRGFALALQQLLHVFGNLLAVFQRLAGLLAELRQDLLRRQPVRRARGQGRDALAQRLQLLAHHHTALTGIGDAGV